MIQIIQIIIILWNYLKIYLFHNINDSADSASTNTGTNIYDEYAINSQTKQHVRSLLNSSTSGNGSNKNDNVPLLHAIMLQIGDSVAKRVSDLIVKH